MEVSSAGDELEELYDVLDGELAVFFEGFLCLVPVLNYLNASFLWLLFHCKLLFLSFARYFSHANSVASMNSSHKRFFGVMAKLSCLDSTLRSVGVVLGLVVCPFFHDRCVSQHFPPFL